MLCIILTEPAHCGREVTVLDTLSMRLDCEDTATAVSLVRRLQIGKNRLGKPVLILYEGERVLPGGRRINKPPQNGFGGGSETLGAALR